MQTIRKKNVHSFEVITQLIDLTQNNFIERIEIIEHMDDILEHTMNDNIEVMKEAKQVLKQLASSIRSISFEVVKAINDCFFRLNNFFFEHKKHKQHKSGNNDFLLLFSVN